LGFVKGCRAQPLLFKVKTKYTIVFLAAIVLLLVSEYLFLTEFSEAHRLLILLLSATGVLLSSFIAIFCYIRSAKDIA
jgi:hypothetical protein